MIKHVITNENKTIWVCKDNIGSYSLTTDSSKASIFDSKVTAETVFKHNLSKIMKSKGIAVKVVTLQIADTTPKEVQRVEPEVGSSKHIISIISEAAAQLNCRHQKLTEQESKYDRQKSDIEHYIEFNAGKLNACDGYKAYKLLQDILLERRKIKDEIQIINVVRDRMAAEDIANIEKKVEELESRTYEPRELTYLFEKEK